MKLRYITVPKNDQAAERLDLDIAGPDELFEIALTEAQYRYLDGIGLFEKINDITGAIIDDFEYEVVSRNIANVVKLHEKLIKAGNDNELLVQIKGLFEEVYRRDQGVYFFF